LQTFQLLKPGFQVCYTIGEIRQPGRSIAAGRIPSKQHLDVPGELRILREVYGRLFDPAAASKRRL
jgi:hypothetical protein